MLVHRVYNVTIDDKHLTALEAEGYGTSDLIDTVTRLLDTGDTSSSLYLIRDVYDPDVENGYEDNWRTPDDWSSSNEVLYGPVEFEVEETDWYTTS